MNSSNKCFYMVSSVLLHSMKVKNSILLSAVSNPFHTIYHGINVYFYSQLSDSATKELHKNFQEILDCVVFITGVHVNLVTEGI